MPYRRHSFLPWLKDYFFSQDSMTLWGLRSVDGSQWQSVSVSPSTGLVADFCPGVTGDQMQIKEIEAGHFLILSYAQNLSTLNIYSKSKSCVKVNSLLVASHPTGLQMQALSEFGISIDKKKILVQFDNLSLAKASSSHLYYVPLDGKPAFLISTPTYLEASLSQATFLNDSRTVIYMGNQIKPDETGLFLWKAPK